MRVEHALTLLSLIILVNSTCLDPNQVDGQCTACADLEILIQGGCYAKLRGCLEYSLPGPLCTLCQNGYVLV